MYNKLSLVGVVLILGYMTLSYRPKLIVVSKATPEIVEVEIRESSSDPVYFQSAPEPILWDEPLTEVRHSNVITPMMIPNTSPRWDLKYANGKNNINESDLRAHIFREHGIAIQRMFKLKTNDLIRLHTYLHNGGKL